MKIRLSEQAHRDRMYKRLRDLMAESGTSPRKDYGEPRFITAGWLRGRFVVVVWTPRGGGRRIISMRYGHGDEEAYSREQLG